MTSTIDTTENTLQVNKFARRNRHLRVFSKALVLIDGVKMLTAPIGKVADLTGVVKVRQTLSAVKAGISDVLPTSPQKRIFSQAIILSAVALIMTSISPGGSFVAASMTYSTDYIEAYSSPGDVLVTDDDGYLVKVNPQTDDSNRIGLTDYAVHTVESGETLSQIAGRYGVGMDTIKWENGISNSNSLRIGQKLMVPPVDGISYEVKSTDSLSKIAKKYEISTDAIVAQNGLDSTDVTKGQKIFLPNAKPLVATAPTVIAASSGAYIPATANRGNGFVASSAAPAGTAPAGGKIFIRPTRGIITQGYHAGHYGIDIADKSKPPIWAAGSGTIIKASVGTWGGGYGNHVIIDHGGGLQSLYAHMDSVNVSVGQWVNQGDVIGIMGNTGRVYGVTGIHLHWEVRQNGVKQYPGNYY